MQASINDFITNSLQVIIHLQSCTDKITNILKNIIVISRIVLKTAFHGYKMYNYTNKSSFFTAPICRRQFEYLYFILLIFYLTHHIFSSKDGGEKFTDSYFFLFLVPSHIFFITPPPLEGVPVQNIHSCLLFCPNNRGIRLSKTQHITNSLIAQPWSESPNCTR